MEIFVKTGPRHDDPSLFQHWLNQTQRQRDTNLLAYEKSPEDHLYKIHLPAMTVTVYLDLSTGAYMLRFEQLDGTPIIHDPHNPLSDLEYTLFLTLDAVTKHVDQTLSQTGQTP